MKSAGGNFQKKNGGTFLSAPFFKLKRCENYAAFVSAM